MKKRVFSTFLALCLLLSLLPFSVSADGEGTGLSADDPMAVPEEGMVIQNKIYYLSLIHISEPTRP